MTTAEAMYKWNESRRMRLVGGYCPPIPAKRIIAPLPAQHHVVVQTPVKLYNAVSDGVRRPEVLSRHDLDIAYLQVWYDDKLPGASIVNTRHDQMMVEMSDLELSIDKISLTVAKCASVRRDKTTLKPVLRTMMPARRDRSQTESVLSIKRNTNAPVLTNEMDPEFICALLFDNFVESFVIDRALFEAFGDNELDVNPWLIQEWLTRQPPNVAAACESSEPLSMLWYGVFDFMIKSDVKPPLDKTAVNTYASVQCISYQKKDISVIFCPVFCSMCERLMAVLAPNVLIFSDLSVTEFEDMVNDRFNAALLDVAAQVEIDMSKYDKSQSRAALEFQCRLYADLGMSAELIAIWRDAHLRSTIVDRMNGVKFDVECQRKSGDAKHFLRKTVFLMSVLAACYDFSDVMFGIFAGDDSVLYFRPGVFVEYDPSQRMADLFNLEAKLLKKYHFPYFCSKFLVVADGWLHFVPDPLKFVTKLDRCDIRDEQHLKEYATSCEDSMARMFNDLMAQKLAFGVSERYGGTIYDITKLLRVLHAVVARGLKDLFKT
ncbi:uncharacterized protein LOC134536419 [Bacillus rossius redtenbacheri]|uniref:uncharacterized protein LOC134536419 n=1 Tax=Bacillus rossius redtenbacheri TaxID=93214 RepID=UPI002FDE0729